MKGKGDFMKNLKKLFATIVSLVTISSCLSVIPLSAETNLNEAYVPIDYYYKYDNTNVVSHSEFGTVLEKNVMNIAAVDATEDYTTLTWDDGFTYTIPHMADDLVTSYQILDHTEECYYIVGYTVSCSGLHAYNIGYHDYNKPDTVTLPDGTVLHPDEIFDCYDIEIAYNLDGEYMGYRIVQHGEDGLKSGIISTSNTNSNESENPVDNQPNDDGLYSTPTNVRGDVNYDGLVNNIDVMVLRKYILHLIEW